MSKWFQVHLSTVILLSLEAGVLLYLNAVPAVPHCVHDEGTLLRIEHHHFGWPYYFYYRVTVTSSSDEILRQITSRPQFWASFLVRNILIGIVILVLSCLVLESCYRFAARKH